MTRYKKDIEQLDIDKNSKKNQKGKEKNK